MSRMSLDTAIRLSAEVKGGGNITKVQQSLQDLAKGSKITARDMDALRTVTAQYARASEGSIAGLRNSIVAFRGLQEQARIGGREFRRYGDELARLESRLKSLDQTSNRTALVAGLAGGVAGAIAVQAANVAGQGARGIVSVGLDAESARVRLRALSNEFGEYNKAQAASARIAQTLRLSTIEAEDAFAGLYASLRPTGVTLEEIEKAFIGFTAAARNSGATAQESAAAMIQLRQALSSGILQGEELRSIREQAPLVAQAIAQEMGVTIGKLKELGAEGKITTNVMLRALARLNETQLDKLNEQFNTGRQAIKDFQVGASILGTEIARIFGPSAVSLLRTFTGALRDAANVMGSLTGNAQSLENIKIEQRASDQAGAEANQKFELFTFDQGGKSSFFQNRRRQIMQQMQRERASVLPASEQLTPAQIAAQQAAVNQRAQQAAAAAAGAKVKKGVKELLRLTDAEITAAVNTAIGEYGGLDPRGRTDVFANILARSRSGKYPPNLVDVVTQPGQYAPNFGRSRSQVTNPNLYGRARFEQVKSELTNPRLLAQSIQDVDSRLYFKGISQQGNMVPGVDFMRARDQNFFHGPGRSDPGRNPQITSKLLGELGGSDAIVGYIDKQTDAAERLREQLHEQLRAADSINVALKDRLALAQTTEPVARQMLEYDIKQNELAREYEQLKSTAGPDELILLNANLIIEQRIEQIEHEEKLNSLLAERATLMANIAAQAAMPTVYNELETQEAALQAVLDKYPAIGAAADAASTLATSGVSEMIAGTKSAKEVFVDFLSSIADALMDTAKQMIAQYIAIGIARMFAGMGGSVATDAGGWATSFATPQAGIGTGFNFNAGAMTGGTPWSFAGGGYTGNAPRAGGVDGQGGFPAILHPRETVIDHTRAISRQGAATMASAPVNVTVNVDASGNSQVSGDQNQGAQLGRVIAGAVEQELVRQKRPGGLLAS
jgi:tape measure domain-containing protein